jgi:hypothetical protein
MPLVPLARLGWRGWTVCGSWLWAQMLLNEKSNRRLSHMRVFWERGLS